MENNINTNTDIFNQELKEETFNKVKNFYFRNFLSPYVQVKRKEFPEFFQSIKKKQYSEFLLSIKRKNK